MNLIAISQSIVTEVSREQISGNFLVYINENHNLPTIVLVVGLIMLTSIFVTNHQRLPLLLTSLFSQRNLSQLLREGKLATKNLFAWVQVVIFIIQALFLYIILEYFFPKVYLFTNPYFLYGITLALVLFDYLFKRVSSYLYFNMFNYKEEFASYKLYKLLFNFSNTVFLMFIIPLSLYSYYWKSILIFIPIFIITFSITSVKIFTINPKRIKLFQFFIYFCTLEILPYLVALKFVITLNK